MDETNVYLWQDSIVSWQMNKPVAKSMSTVVMLKKYEMIIVIEV